MIVVPSKSFLKAIVNGVVVVVEVVLGMVVDDVVVLVDLKDILIVVLVVEVVFSVIVLNVFGSVIASVDAVVVDGNVFSAL